MSNEGKQAQGGGLNAAAAPERDADDLGGAGMGASVAAGAPSGGLLSTGGTTAGLTDDNIAAEAGALGRADGSLADAQGNQPAAGTGGSGGEAIGGGAGRGQPGLGTAGDRGETGGSDPLVTP